MGQRSIGRVALGAAALAGTVAAGCEPAPTEAWRSELVSTNATGTSGANALSFLADLNADGTKSSS